MPSCLKKPRHPMVSQQKFGPGLVGVPLLTSFDSAPNVSKAQSSGPQYSTYPWISRTPEHKQIESWDKTNIQASAFFIPNVRRRVCGRRTKCRHSLGKAGTPQRPSSCHLLLDAQSCYCTKEHEAWPAAMASWLCQLSSNLPVFSNEQTPPHCVIPSCVSYQIL